MLVQMFVVELLLCSKDGLRSDLRASKLQGEHAPRVLQLYTHTSNPATSNMMTMALLTTHQCLLSTLQYIWSG